MKIVGFTTVLPFAGRLAGGSVFYHEVAKRFAQLGFEVTIITKTKKNKDLGDLYLDGVRYVAEGSYKDADYILLHSASLDKNPRFQQFFNKPIIYILHSLDRKILGDLYNLREKDYLVSNSKTVYKEVCSLKTHHVIINPVCNQKYNKSLHNSKKYFTLIGSSVVKNIELFYAIAKKNPFQDFLHIQGGYGNCKLDRPKNMVLVHNVSDLRPFYSQTKILLVPSFTETYSLVAREAGLQGIPVVCSDLPGLRENLGDTGLYANPRKIKTFEEQLDKLKTLSYYNKVSYRIKEHCQRAEADNLVKLDKLIKSL